MSVRLNHPTVRLLRRSSSSIQRDSSDFLGLRFRASPLWSSRSLGCCCKFEGTSVLNALGREGSLQELDDSPVSVELSPISSEAQFDRVIAEAQQLDASDGKLVQEMHIFETKVGKVGSRVLSKLACISNNELLDRLRFYCVDVNAVPHRLVSHAGVTKMPTIQMWKDGKKEAEVIGGHKAYLVLNEVRDMIENDDTL